MQFLIIRNNGSSVVYWSQIAQCFVKGEEYMPSYAILAHLL